MLVTCWTLFFSLAWCGALGAGAFSSSQSSARAQQQEQLQQQQQQLQQQEQLQQQQLQQQEQLQQQQLHQSHSDATQVGLDARLPVAHADSRQRGGRITGRAIVTPALHHHHQQQQQQHHHPDRDENAIHTGRMDERDSSTGDAHDKVATVVSQTQHQPQHGQQQQQQQPHRQPLHHHLLHRHQQQQQRQRDTETPGGTAAAAAAAAAGEAGGGARSPGIIWEASGLVQEEGGFTRTSRQARNSRGRNWCAYVRTRLSPTALADGSETYVGKATQQCPWTYGVCGIVYRVMQRPSYRVKHLIVTSLEWRCCPGHDGTNCDPKDRPGRHDGINNLEKHLVHLAQLQRDVANVSGALGDVRGSLRALEDRVAVPRPDATSNRISEDDVTELVKKLVQQQMAELHRALYEPVRRIASTVAGLAKDVELSRRDAAVLNGSVADAARACGEALLLARGNERSIAELASSELHVGSQSPPPGAIGNHGVAEEEGDEEKGEDAAERVREELERLRHSVVADFSRQLGDLREDVRGRIEALGASVADAERRQQWQQAALRKLLDAPPPPPPPPPPESPPTAGPGHAAPTGDWHGVRETMAIHAALINDTSERVWELAQLLRQWRQEEEEEEAAACGMPCTELVASARDAQRLAHGARDAEERLDGLQRLLRANLSSTEEGLRQATGAVRDLYRETGELRLALSELQQQQLQQLQQLQQQQQQQQSNTDAPRARADTPDPDTRPPPGHSDERLDASSSTLDELAGDVAALKLSHDDLLARVQQESRAQALHVQELHDALAARMEGGARKAGARLDVLAARGEAMAHDHGKLERHVERLYNSSVDTLLHVSSLGQRLDDLNSSFNTLLEDTLRHTLVLEAMGAFDESDYDDDDDDDDDGDDGDDGYGAPKRSINLLELNKGVLAASDSALRNGKALDQMVTQVRNLKQQLDDRVANLERRFLSGGAGGVGGSGGDGDGSGDAARDGSLGVEVARLRDLEVAARESRQQRRFLEEKLRDLESSCCGGGGGGGGGDSSSSITIGDVLEEFRQEVEHNITSVRLTLEAIPLDEVRRELIAEVSERVNAALLDARRGKGAGRRRQRKKGKGPGRGPGAGGSGGSGGDDEEEADDDDDDAGGGGGGGVGGEDFAGAGAYRELAGDEDAESHLERRKRRDA
uniref:Uncharacterized protein LOC116940169 isoform X2 n=1 Tax=Petromyzon marinus TaxID=7757 RepID=A0AAJ7WPK5_PETMA|nr:uncharacterized protein LOC116940169 isoform X2 [Petromyzon marinus]